MLGRYRLEHELGAGAMGVVYAAFDPDLERRVALKVLRVVAPIPGAHVIRSVGDIVRVNKPGVQSNLAIPVVGQHLPAPVLDKIRPGDLVAHFEHVRSGDMTVCAGGFAGDLPDPDDYQRSAAHLGQLVVKCKHIGPGDAIVELAVPPQSRMD